MAKKQRTNNEEQTSLATGGGGGESSALASSGEAVDLLAGHGLDDLETDGLEEIDQDDIKIPAKVFNFKGQDQDGDPIPANRFFDTIAEETQREIDCALLTFHKTNEWREYDQEKEQSIVRCRSVDRVAGVMDGGAERKCAGCPDAQWAVIDGKRTRRCGPVYNVVGVERLTRQPFIVRFKRTSLTPFQTYLNRYFMGKRIVGGKRQNYPLFAFPTKIALKMDPGGKYAFPVFETELDAGNRPIPLPAEEIRAHAESAAFYREAVLPVLNRISDQDAGGDAPTSSSEAINPDEFSDDAPAQSAGGKW